MNKHCFLNHERTSQRFQGEGCFERLQHMVHIAIAIEKKKMLGIRLGLSMANNTLEKTNTDSIGNQRLSFVIFLLLSEGNEGAKIRTELMTFFKKRCNDTISPLIFLLQGVLSLFVLIYNCVRDHRVPAGSNCALPNGPSRSLPKRHRHISAVHLRSHLARKCTRGWLHTKPGQVRNHANYRSEKKFRVVSGQRPL